jgi:hypothetical protein
MAYRDPKKNQNYRDASTVAPPAGPSNGMLEQKIDRKGQSILTPTPSDACMRSTGIESSIHDQNFRGDGRNLGASYQDD